MKQIKSEEELKGKTVERCRYSDNAYAIFFTDNTFIVFSGIGWEDNDVDINTDSFDLTPNVFNINRLSEWGVITTDEYNYKIKQYSEESMEREGEHERQLYDKLKKKYDDKNHD